MNSYDPVLLYAPGLGEYASNTAAGVAEVLAAVLSRSSQGDYRAEAIPWVTAPKGLRLGKSIVDPSGAPVLHVFQLDYGTRMRPESPVGGPAPPPGVVRSGAYAVAGLLRLIAALGRPAKNRRAKAQLAYAFATVVVPLLVSAVVATVAALVAAGVDVPNIIKKIALPSGAAVIGGWALLRRRLLAAAASVQRNMRYLGQDRHRDSVTLVLDDAVDGLLDNGWTGPVHLLGYSFGSIVLIDALFPSTTRIHRNKRVEDAIVPLTTIGCPLDYVRLLWKDHIAADQEQAAKQDALADGEPVAGLRMARVPKLNWVNVYIPADILGSNLRDGSDDPNHGNPLSFGDVIPSTRPYGNEPLGWRDLLTYEGLRNHGGYWGTLSEASCFDEDLLLLWLAQERRRLAARAPGESAPPES